MPNQKEELARNEQELFDQFIQSVVTDGAEVEEDLCVVDAELELPMEAQSMKSVIRYAFDIAYLDVANTTKMSISQRRLTRDIRNLVDLKRQDVDGKTWWLLLIFLILFPIIVDVPLVIKAVALIFFLETAVSILKDEDVLFWIFPEFRKKMKKAESDLVDTFKKIGLDKTFDYSEKEAIRLSLGKARKTTLFHYLKQKIRK